MAQSQQLILLIGGIGVWVFRWGALIPGLVPLLALTAVFILPFVVVTVLAAALGALPLAIWRRVAR